MNPDKSHRCTGSMMSAAVNMVIQMCGNISLISLIISQSQQLLITNFSACMEDFPQLLILWNISDNLIEYRRFPMKAPCAISSGRTPMKRTDGVFPNVEQATPSAPISPNNLSTIIN